MDHIDHDRFFAAITRDEGCVIENGRHVAYQDPLGYWTIGYGKLIDKQVPGGGLTENEAVFLLKNTVQDMWNELEQSLPWIKEKPIIVQEQILNMVYNLGLPNLLKFQNMLAALESNDGTTAADEALNSKWARQVGQRAQRIADIFRAEL